MKEMIKKLMVVLVSAFLLMGTVITPVEAKGSKSSGNNGWNPWGWFWGWGYPQPTQPEPEPEPTEEPVVEEETEEPEIEEEEEETPAVEEEPVIVEEPVVEEEPVADEPVVKAQEFDAVSYTEGYSATISFEEDAQIADGAQASIEKYEEDTDEFAAAKEAVLEAKGVEEEEIGFIAFDMTLYDAEGNEIEPDGGLVNVALSVQLPEEALNAADTLEIHHLNTSSGEIVVETVASSEDVSIINEEVVAQFEVDSFSAYTISWYSGGNRSYTINYVDTTGASVTPTMTPTFTNNTMFLNYDVEGYEYDSTHINSLTGTTIAPLLRINGTDRQYYDGITGWFDYDPWTDLRNNIYVVYKKKADPTQGGVVPPPSEEDEEWPEDENAPQFSKTSKNNGDGTNTISLSIAAGEKPVENKTKANVIVVFDGSGSMSNNINGGAASQQNPARLTLAKNAVNSMASTLLSKTDSQGNKLVDMALVGFSTDAARRGTWTNNASTFAGNTYLGGINASGGTNWEKSLAIANRIENDDSEAATFIIFVTDGNPTFRMTRGNVDDAGLDMYTATNYQYYRENSVFGTGSSDNSGRNYDFAIEEIKSIIAQGKNFYAIGISNDADKFHDLATDAGLSADHGILATSEAELNAAFEKIAQSISSKLGFGDVEMTDGITEMTNTSMEVMHSVDENSFQYYRSGGEGNKYGTMTEWTTREQDGCAAATYNEETGAVEWNMGEGFQLEANVTYTVTFRCWPSQEAYDLVADLNNHIIDYDDLTPEQKAQIVEVTAVPENYFALKTNTENVQATYKKTTKTGDTVTISDDQPIDATYHEGDLENMNLESMLLTVKKEFEDDLTGGEDRETQVTLVLRRRNAHQNPEAEFADYAVPQADGTVGPYIVLNDANNWTYQLYVAPGFESHGEVLEHGYDFTIAEPNIDYHYGLIEEIINPMVVDGVDKYYGDGYLIDDEATIQDYVDRSLTAVNRVKSGIDVRKVVVDDEGNEISSDKDFTITGKILDPEGNPYNFDNAAYDQRTDKNSNTWVPENQSSHQNDPIAYHKYVEDSSAVPGQSGAIEAYGKTYRRTIYKGHFDSTGAIEFTLKSNEMIRFINVPDGCTFEFDEDITKMPEDYEWFKSEGTTQHKTAVDGDYTTEGDIQPTVSGSKVSITKDENSTGVVGNKQYTVIFTNKSVKGEYFYVYHSSNNTIEKIFADDARVTKGEYDEETKTYPYTFNIVNETNEGTLYGGYFKSYNGAGMSDEDIKDADYTENGTSSSGVYSSAKTTGFWAADANGSSYDGSTVYWKVKQAYTDTVEETGGGKGTAMTVKANTVYYLKEIPDQYFRPALYYVYDDRSANKDLKKLYMMVPTDDSVYNNVGAEGTVNLGTTTKLYTTYKVTDFNGNSVSYNAKAANANLPRGYITVWDGNSKIAAGTTYDWTPNFITKDGVKVTSAVKRTIVMGNAGFEPGKSNQKYTEEQSDITGFYVYDSKIDSTAN